MEYKELYPNLQSFTSSIKAYVLEFDRVNDEYYIALNWLDKASRKAFKNANYRARLASYITHGSTIELRDLMAEVGCDYWGNLIHSNACDLIDSVHCHRGNINNNLST